MTSWDRLTSGVDCAYYLRKISGAIELAFVDAVLVGGEDAVYSVALGVENIAVQREAVTGLLALSFDDSGSEAVGWDLLVGIIVLQNVTNRPNRLHVLVFGFVTHVMQRLGLVSLLIREREIYGDTEIDLAAAEDVLQETCAPPHFKAGDVDFHASYLKRLFSFLEFIEASRGTTQEFVGTFSFELKQVDLDFVVVIIVAESVSIKQHLSPTDRAPTSWLALSLIHWSIFTRSVLFPKNHEETIFAGRYTIKLNQHIFET